MKRAHGLPVCLLLISFLVPLQTHAGQWGLGLGVASQGQPQRGSESQVFVLPFPSYQGERLSLDFGNVRYALSRSDRFRFAVEGQIRFDGYDPTESPALAGLEERDATLDAGFSLTSTRAWGVASLKAVGDVLGVHEGFEVSASYEYPMQLGSWVVSPSIGVSWLSEELVDYYYGVRTSEAMPDRPAYFGDSAINASAGVNAVYRLGTNWDLLAGMQYVRFSGEITDSPIIADDHQIVTYSAMVYRF